MTAVALREKAFIQAAGYSLGRNNGDVDWIVLHTAEGSTEGRGLGNYFAGTTKGSSNAGIDDFAYWLYVTFNNTPWTNPPINSKSDTVELCAFRAWSRAEWLKHPVMLELTAQFIAWRAAVRGIPIRLITGADAVAGRKGVLDHKRVNDGFHKSDHTDVGPGFPWDVVISRAQTIANVVPPAPKPVWNVTPEGDRVLGLYDPVLRDLPGNHDVSSVQNVLRVLGNNIIIDGIYDQQTAGLVNVFKQHRGIVEAGWGEECWRQGRKIVHGG